MLAINPQQREFVFALMGQGLTLNYTEAARSAGYATTEGSQRDAGYRLAHDEKVLAAIHEEAYKRLRAGTLAATALLTEFVAAEAVDPAVRLKAATALMDRGGLHARSEHLVAVTHSDDRAAKVARLVELARAQGQDPREVLGSLADAIEGDYAVLEPAAEPGPTQEEAAPTVTEVSRETLPAPAVRPLVTDITDVEPVEAAVRWR